MNKIKLQTWTHIRKRALECIMIVYSDYPNVKDKLDDDLKITQDLLTKGK